MVWTDDPVGDAERWAEAYLNGEYTCDLCGELLGGHGYRIGETLICPACLDKYYREEI